jgi:hypothetical protein
MNVDRMLWKLIAGDRTTACVMVSCCAGAELRVVRSTADGDEQIVLRELYPDHDSLYERARQLKAEMAQDSGLKSQGAQGA